MTYPSPHNQEMKLVSLGSMGVFRGGEAGCLLGDLTVGLTPLSRQVVRSVLSL